MKRPFSTGTQYLDWTDRNCERCTKYDPIEFQGNCEIDGALGLALIGHGEVSDEIATRMGYDDNANYFTWDCPERELR